MNIPGILYNFRLETQNLATFLVKWNWNTNSKKVAYFQISHSYQQENETKTVYSALVPGTIVSSFILDNVEPQHVYQICLTVFVRDFPKNHSNPNTVINKSSVLNPNKICLISLPKSSHIQAIVSCLIGVLVALLLIGLIIVLCRIHQRWTKSKYFKADLPGSNKDYYERHRNSETTGTDDFSGFDDCENSCSSQMIAEGLAWSPSSSMTSQLNFSMLRSKSSLYNHSSSHPSSTPRIMEEDPFLEAFTDKVPISTNDERHAQSNDSNKAEPSLTQSITSPMFSTNSCSTLNSNTCDPGGPIFFSSRTDSVIVNEHLVFDDDKSFSHTFMNGSSHSDLVLQLIDQV